MKNFIGKSLLTLLLAAGCSLGASSQARYVFYFIGDGMGMGHVNATEAYNRDVLKSDTPILMLNFPVAGQVRTHSANNPVTDSAAGGTALATGHKTRNGMIGENADSLSIESVAVEFARNGFAVGIATSVAGDDATPAAFYAHAHNRGLKYEIAPQAATSGFEFLAGARWRGMLDKEGRENSWTELMAQNGYLVSRGYEQWTENAKSRPAKSLLLSANPAGDQVGYTIDSIPGALTIQQITAAGLQQLENSGKDKFFLMAEGGNIDWAAHANDGGAVIKEVLNYQKAIDVAYQFYLKHPDETLIVVTADHDTGGMALGSLRGQKGYNLWMADFQKISKDRFSDYCKSFQDGKKQITWPEMKEFMTENLGLFGTVKVSEKEEKELQAAFNKAFVEKSGQDQKTLYANYNSFTKEVFDLFNDKMNIGWTATYHTGNFVPVYAVGRGAELFSGNLDNTQIPARILRAAGL